MNQSGVAASARYSFLVISDTRGEAEKVAALIKSRLGFDVDLRLITDSATLEPALLSRRWDVVLYTLTVQYLAPDAAVRWISTLQPHCALLLAAEMIEARTAVDLMRLGASGFVEIGDPQRFVAVLRRELKRISPQEPARPSVAEYELRHEALRNALPDLLVIVNPSGVITDLQGPTDRLPYPPKAIVGRTLRELLPAKLVERAMAAIVKVFTTRQLVSFEYTMPIQKGQLSFECRLVPLGDGDRVLAIIREVTERKRIETALRASQELYRTLLDSADAAISMVDRDGIYLYLNEIAARPFGVEPEALIGKHVADLFPPDETEKVLADVRRVIDQRRGVVLEPQVTLGSQSHWFHTSIQPVNDASGWPYAALIFASDITDRKETDLALRASELRYRNIVEDQVELVCRYDPNFNLTFANGAYCRMCDEPLEELLGRSVLDRVAEEDRVQVRMDLGALSTAHPIAVSVQRVNTAQGDTRWFEWKSRAIFDPHGGLVEYQGVGRDITEQRRAETALQTARDHLERRVVERTAELERTRDRLEAIFEHSGDGILLFNRTDGIQQANYTFSQMFGVKPGDTQGRPLTAFVQPEDAAAIAAVVEEVAASHVTRHVEAQALCADGTGFDVEISVAPVNRSPRPVANIVCIFRDVRRRKQAERAIAEERNRLRTVIDALPDFIYVKDADHRMVLNNLAHAHSVGGHTAADVVGKTDFELFPPEMAAAFYADEEALLVSGRPIINREERSLGEDGREIWALTTKLPLRNVQGDVVGLVGITRDISDLKASEDALRRSEKQLRESQNMLQLVLDTIPVRVFWKDCNSVYLGCNRLLAEDVGLSQTSDIVGRQDREMAAPEAEAAAYRADDMAIIESGIGKVDFEETVRTADGKRLIVSTTKLPLRDAAGAVIGVLGAYVDITDRKRTEAALEQKHREELEMQRYLKALHTISLQLARTETIDAFYRGVVELGLAHFAFERMGLLLRDGVDGAAIGTYGTNAAGQVVDEHGLRLDPSSLTGILKRTLNHDARIAIEENAELFDNFVSIGRGQNAVSALWSDDQVLGWLAIDNGVHRRPLTRAQLDAFPLYALTAGSLLARKHAESALRQSEERFRRLFESAPVATLITDQDGRIVLINQAAAQLFGYDPAELIGQPVEVLVPVNRVDLHVAHRAAYLTLPHQRRQQPLELEARCKDGSLFPAEIHLSIVETEAAPLVMSFVTNIAERKQAEQTLKQSLAQEKEIGELKSRLVAVFSHDFRNPLMAIMASTSVIREVGERLPPEKLAQHLDRIDDSTRLLAQMIEDMLTLAAMGSGQFEFAPQPVDLAAVVCGICEECRLADQAGHTITVESMLHHPVQADLKLIRQIVTNLVANAVKYSPPASVVAVTLVETGGSVVLTVADQGIGIPEESLARLYEPFHRATNARHVRGTGLGLSIVKGCVDHHHGRISVASTVGAGTTFTVELPQSYGTEQPGG